LLKNCDKKSLPTIEMECFKDGDNIESITLQGKTFFVFGRNQARVDLTLMHESISREHVVLLFDA